MIKFIMLLFSFLYLFASENVTIQLNWKYQFEFAGFIMAKEKGFYKREGLNVTLNELNKNSNNIVEWVTKDMNRFGVGNSSLFRDGIKNKPIKLLMPIYKNSLLVLVAVNLKLKSLQEAKKFIWNVTQFTLKDPAIWSMLKSKNIDISSLNVKPYSGDEKINKKGIYSIYESNEIYTLSKNNIPYTIFNPKDYGFNFYSDILFTSNKELALHPKQVQKVMNATKEGYIYAFNHIDETIDMILKKYNTQHLTREKLEYEASVLKNDLSDDFKFNMDKVQNIENIYFLLGEVDEKKASDFIYNPLKFTQKELYFIKTHIIKAVSTATWEPFNLFENHKLQGIAVDYWRYIRKQLNIESRCFVANKWVDVLDSIRLKENDITCSTTITPSRKKYAIFSKPYVSFPIVIATRNDVGFISDLSLLKNKKIAVGKNYTAEKLLKQHYPNIKLMEVRDTDQALRLVSDGKVFGVVDILPVIAYKINKYSYSNLKISGKTRFMFNVRFMVRNDYPELVSIINKIIFTMPQYQKEKILSKWMAVHYQTGYEEKYVNKMFIIWGIILFIVIILIIMLIKNIFMREKKETELEKLATMDKLTSVFNRYKIDMALNEQIEISKRYKRPLSVIFFDIDHFKRVNDTYGHKLGDYVLIELAKIVNSNIRSSDIFGRWGGEEFLLILPETSLNEANKLAEKLKNLIQKHHFKKVLKITCSFGVTTYRDETLEHLIERVDKLLYNSKETGRNRVSVG